MIIGGLIPLTTLADLVSIGALFAFMLVSIAVAVLRHTRPELDRPFRVPLSPVLPIVSALACLYLSLNLSVATWIRFAVWFVHRPGGLLRLRTPARPPRGRRPGRAPGGRGLRPPRLNRPGRAVSTVDPRRCRLRRYDLPPRGKPVAWGPCGPSATPDARPGPGHAGSAPMHAMVYRGPYRVRVEEKDVPAIEHPNDAIVRVQLAAICGSDLHLYHGLMPDTRVGHTFGHEFIGVVDEVGSVGAEPAGRRPGDGALQRLLRVVLLLRPRPVLATATTSTRTPRRSAASTATRTPPAATTAARPSTCGCRSPTSARARSPTGCRRGRGAAHRRLPDGLLRRPARRHHRGRHRRRVRRRPGRPVRGPVGVADGRRPGHRRRPPGSTGWRRRARSPTPRRSTTTRSTTSCWS